MMTSLSTNQRLENQTTDERSRMRESNAIGRIESNVVVVENIPYSQKFVAKFPSLSTSVRCSRHRYSSSCHAT